MEVTTRLVYDFDLTPREREECKKILCEIFPEYPKDRDYYKQKSILRLLAYSKERLIGHLSVVYRAISHSTGQFPIFGVVDVVVRENVRNRGVASRMLAEVEAYARVKHIPFLVLFADTYTLYLKNGFHNKENICRWFMIDDIALKSTGVEERSLADCLMVKQLADQPWPEGQIDLLGHVF